MGVRGRENLCELYRIRVQAKGTNYVAERKEKL